MKALRHWFFDPHRPFTGPVALSLSGQMAVAYFIAHSPQAFWPFVE